MLKKSTIVVALLLGMLFAFGYAEAAERESSTRPLSVRSVAAAATQDQPAGSLSLSKILRLRFLRTLQILIDLEETEPEPPIFGTNGLSDGPDPIDGAGQAGGGAPPPIKQEKSGSQEGGAAGEDPDSPFGLG